MRSPRAGGSRTAGTALAAPEQPREHQSLGGNGELHQRQEKEEGKERGKERSEGKKGARKGQAMRTSPFLQPSPFGCCAPLPACTDSRLTILAAGAKPRCAQPPPAVSPRLPGAASLASLPCHPLPVEAAVAPRAPRAPLPVAMQGQVSGGAAPPRPTSGSLGCPDTRPGVRPMQTLPFAY